MISLIIKILKTFFPPNACRTRNVFKILIKYAIYVYYRSSGNELYYLLGKKYWYQMTCRIKEKLAKLDNGLRSQKNKRMELFIIFAIYYSFGKDTDTRVTTKARVTTYINIQDWGKSREH